MTTTHMHTVFNCPTCGTVKCQIPLDNAPEPKLKPLTKRQKELLYSALNTLTHANARPRLEDSLWVETVTLQQAIYNAEAVYIEVQP
jgi:hypothetical protein